MSLSAWARELGLNYRTWLLGSTVDCRFVEAIEHPLGAALPKR